MDLQTRPPKIQRRRRKQPSTLRRDLSKYFVWPGRVVLITLVVIAPWWIGSVSALAQLVLFILALIGLACWWFELAFSQRRNFIVPYLAIPVALGIVLAVVQMAPLPGRVARLAAAHQVQQNRTFGTTVDGEREQLELLQGRRPRTSFSMASDQTLQVANLLVLALICVLLSGHYFSTRGAITGFSLVVTLNGVAISIFGLVQKINFNGKLFWFIERTQGGWPFGPFVNENNAAGYLLICLGCSLVLTYLAFSDKHERGRRPRLIITNEYTIWRRIGLKFLMFVSELNARKVAAFLAVVTIAAGVVSTLSRGGVTAMIVGFLATTWVVGFSKSSKNILGILALSLVLVVALTSWIGVGGELANQFQRLSDAQAAERLPRLRHWAQTAPAIIDYAPMGSGLGTYAQVHRLYRQDAELRLYEFAENQYFQTLVEAGFVGLILLLAALAMVGYCTLVLLKQGNSRKTIAVGLLGVFVLSTQCIAALFDFGLFIPANTVLMAVICGVICGQAHSLADRLKRFQFLQHKLAMRPTLLALLVVFSVGTLSAMSVYRQARLQGVMHRTPLLEDFRTLDLATTERRIKLLEQEVSRAPTAAGYTRLAELWIHRYRLRQFDLLQRHQPVPPQFDQHREQMLDGMWNATSLDRLYESLYSALAAEDQVRVRRIREDKIIRENLNKARWLLLRSRHLAPLQPGVHLMLGQCQALTELPKQDTVHIARAALLAPANMDIHLVAGLLYIHSSLVDPARLERGCAHLRKCLELDGRYFPQVMALVGNRLDARTIADKIIPNTPGLLYNFAVQLPVSALQSLKTELLERADGILIQAENPSRKSLVMHAEIKLALGDKRSAIELYQKAKQLNPLDAVVRGILADLYVETSQWQLARQETEWLIRRTSDRSAKYERYLRQLRQIQRKEVESPSTSTLLEN